MSYNHLLQSEFSGIKGLASSCAFSYIILFFQISGKMEKKFWWWLTDSKLTSQKSIWRGWFNSCCHAGYRPFQEYKRYIWPSGGWCGYQICRWYWQTICQEVMWNSCKIWWWRISLHTYRCGSWWNVEFKSYNKNFGRS